MQNLFHPDGGKEALAEGAVVLRGQARDHDRVLLAAIEAVEAEAPFRRMTTPGGFEMSAAMTNCGRAGWITDRRGYRYATEDPESGKPWPAMPALFATLAAEAAAAAGFPDFAPAACRLSRYEPGAKQSPHQDRDEADHG